MHTCLRTLLPATPARRKEAHGSRLSVNAVDRNGGEGSVIMMKGYNYKCGRVRVVGDSHPGGTVLFRLLHRLTCIRNA